MTDIVSLGSFSTECSATSQEMPLFSSGLKVSQEALILIQALQQSQCETGQGLSA